VTDSRIGLSITIDKLPSVHEQDVINRECSSIRGYQYMIIIINSYGKKNADASTDAHGPLPQHKIKAQNK
jgi:hypothetical protein